MRVDLGDWVYGTIERHRRGMSWRAAWIASYRNIGGVSEASGRKGCPMAAARTLYQFGRLREAGMPYRQCDISELWRSNRNGTYALIATRLLRTNPRLDKTSLWSAIQDAVRRETEDEPARTNQGGSTVAFQLWNLGLIVDRGPGSFKERSL